MFLWIIRVKDLERLVNTSEMLININESDSGVYNCIAHLSSSNLG